MGRRGFFYRFLALIHFHTSQILSIILSMKLILYFILCIIIFNRHSLNPFSFPIRIDISNPSPCSTIMLLLFDCMQPGQSMSTQPLWRELTVSTVREEPIFQNTMNLTVTVLHVRASCFKLCWRFSFYWWPNITLYIHICCACEYAYISVREETSIWKGALCFQLYGPVFSMSWYGYRYHVTLYIGQQHPITV